MENIFAVHYKINFILEINKYVIQSCKEKTNLNKYALYILNHLICKVTSYTYVNV